MSEPHHIRWQDRDFGQKFSIIMMFVFLCIATLAMTYWAVLDAREGNWWPTVGAVSFVICTFDLISRWRRRNAG